MYVTPLPGYDRATQLRVAALSLWLFRLALGAFGLAPYLDMLLGLLVALGLLGALVGIRALWPRYKRAAAGEAAALGLSLVPATGWLILTYGEAPLTATDLPLGTGPGWAHAAGGAWLMALAHTGYRTGALRPTAIAPAMLLWVLDLPALHQRIFAVAPRVAELLAPMAMVLAVFAMARLARTLRAPR